jgi:predicted transcriptional regulator
MDTQQTPLVSSWSDEELQGRAGGLARELGQQYNFSSAEWSTHWEDMKQTALLAFLEQRDQPQDYAYVCARNALKNYAWVHVRGLNGGWKSLEARNYTLIDTYESIDMDEAGDDNLAWRIHDTSPDYHIINRPVERQVIRREASPPAEAADLFGEFLILLVGISSERWYPEQMYRAAMIIAMKHTGYLWPDIADQLGVDEQEVMNIYYAFREKKLNQLADMSPIALETIRVRGRMRVQWFEQLRPGWLKRPQKKIVVFPHGIYTITYKADSRRPGLIAASLQKGRRVNGRIRTLQVYLGKAEDVTKQLLWEKSLTLEKRLEGFLAKASGNLGRINQSRQVMFGVV